MYPYQSRLVVGVHDESPEMGSLTCYNMWARLMNLHEGSNTLVLCTRFRSLLKSTYGTLEYYVLLSMRVPALSLL